MPVFVRSEPDTLVVEFTRDGEAPETQIVLGLKADRARAGERALLYAISMLINRRLLMVGDQLTVRSSHGVDLAANENEPQR
jgi:hypothetical protein